MSGKAYRSEMLMRRYRLYQSIPVKWYNPKILINRALYEWMFYWIYGRSSGFTQSILSPFFLIISTIFSFAIKYYYEIINIYSNEWNCTYLQSIEHTSFTDSLQMSLSAALPLFNTDIEYSNWWIKSLETFICSTLLVFFILALRKRFKQ